MNCSQTRAQLPEWLYGDLAPDTSAQIEAHLAACAECRREGEALKQVRQALDAQPAPAAEVNLPQLYRAVAADRERQFRRWRRSACILGGLAAGLALFAVLPGLEFRAEGHQFVVRWGSPPAVLQPQPSPTPALPEPAKERIEFISTTAADVEERLGILSDLVQMLADDAGKRDASRSRDLDALRAQLSDLREQSRLWRLSTDRDVAALYSVQFSEIKKGKQP
jgi:hypothetical protein